MSVAGLAGRCMFISFLFEKSHLFVCFSALISSTHASIPGLIAVWSHCHWSWNFYYPIQQLPLLLLCLIIAIQVKRKGAKAIIILPCFDKTMQVTQLLTSAHYVCHWLLHQYSIMKSLICEFWRTLDYCICASRLSKTMIGALTHVQCLHVWL